jgi:hypothetical protein
MLYVLAPRDYILSSHYLCIVTALTIYYFFPVGAITRLELIAALPCPVDMFRRVLVYPVLRLRSGALAGTAVEFHRVALFQTLVVAAIGAKHRQWHADFFIELEFLRDYFEGNCALVIAMPGMGARNNIVCHGIVNSTNVVGNVFCCKGYLVVPLFAISPSVPCRFHFLFGQGKMLLDRSLVVCKRREFHREELAIPVGPPFRVTIGHFVHVGDNCRNQRHILLLRVRLIENVILLVTESHAPKTI